MKLTVKLDQLRYIVNLVATVTPTRSTLPSLSAVLLAYGDCRLTACATDLRSFARAHCEAIGEQSGAFGVRADLLAGWLGNCTAEDVEIDVEARATFQCGTMKTVLAVMKAEEFQAHPQVEGNCLMIGAQELHDALAKVLHAASDDEDNKTVLCSVCFDFSPTLHLVAFSGTQIAIVDMGAEGQGQYIAPREFIAPLLKCLDGQEGQVSVTFSENHILVACEHWSLSIVLINGKFPPWQTINSWTNMPKFTFNRTQLLNAFRSCMPFGEAGFARIMVDGNEIDTRIEIAGENSSSSEIKYQGGPFLFFVNGKYVIALLSALSGDDVTIEYKDEKGKGIVVHENNFTAAIMPLEK